jgi:hypothetical protein
MNGTDTMADHTHPRRWTGRCRLCAKTGRRRDGRGVGGPQQLPPVPTIALPVASSQLPAEDIARPHRAIFADYPSIALVTAQVSAVKLSPPGLVLSVWPGGRGESEGHSQHVMGRRGRVTRGRLSETAPVRRMSRFSAPTASTPRLTAHPASRHPSVDGVASCRPAAGAGKHSPNRPVPRPRPPFGGSQADDRSGRRRMRRRRRRQRR